ncbi:hypothetical protein EDD17DRAFT_1546499 [Pisolithus thermaeus]|nr:hypothetical protein EDD17DRAFT_1546499 [Pisolithus thermaeus]
MERKSILKFLLLTFPISSGGPVVFPIVECSNPRNPAVEPFVLSHLQEKGIDYPFEIACDFHGLDSVAFRGDARSSGFSPFNLSREELACLRTTAHAGRVQNSRSLLHAYHKTLHIHVTLPVLA